MANVHGELSAVNNRCPHRGGPLGQGWVEGESVVCPWHAWTFNLKTGEAEFPVHDRVAVYPVRVEGEDVLMDIEGAAEIEPDRLANP
jgi:nitrite reductase (NADH) small subunit